MVRRSRQAEPLRGNTAPGPCEPSAGTAAPDAARAHMATLERLVQVGTLAAGLVHDLNNRVTIIAGTVETLVHSDSAADEMRSRLRDLLDITTDLGRIGRQLLDLGRRGPSPRQAVDVDELVADTVRTLRPSLASEIAVEVTAGRDMPRVWADPDQIRQVLWNLFTNAVHAMPQGGRLVIRTDTVSRRLVHGPGIEGAQVEPFVRVRVEDTGVGIPRDKLEAVFQPFYTTREKSGGTGLGLTVVRDIVVRHGGFVEVCSREGEGTTFDVHLPMVSDPGTERPPVGTVAGRGRVRSTRDRPFAGGVDVGDPAELRRRE